MFTGESATTRRGVGPGHLPRPYGRARNTSAPRCSEDRHVQPEKPEFPQGDRLPAGRTAVPAAPLGGVEDGEVRGLRGEASRGQGDRPHLREDLDAHPRRIRGGGVRPGGPRHLSRSVGFAARTQGVGRRHRPGPRSDVRRHRVPRQRPDRRRGTRGERRRPRLQRADERVAPDADVGRLPHDARGERQAVRRAVVRVRRRLPVQHGSLAARHGCADGRGRPSRRAGVAGAARRRRADRPGHRRPHRRSHHDHRRRRPGGRGRRLRAHRRLGVDGGAEGRLARPCRSPPAVPGQHGTARDGPATRGRSSCTACRRSTTRTPSSAAR